MSDAVMKAPLVQRINWRIVGFAAVVVSIFGYGVWLYLETELSGGISQRGDHTVVDLKAMSTFVFDKRAGKIEDVPQQWRDLNGKKVITEGEMFVADMAGPMVDKFDLVYSISQCCYSGPPQVQHFVKARPVNGPVPNMHWSRVRVSGTLRVNIERNEFEITSVYQLEVDSVEKIL